MATKPFTRALLAVLLLAACGARAQPPAPTTPDTSQRTLPPPHTLCHDADGYPYKASVCPPGS